MRLALVPVMLITPTSIETTHISLDIGSPPFHLSVDNDCRVILRFCDCQQFLNLCFVHGPDHALREAASSKRWRFSALASGSESPKMAAIQ